MRSRTDSQLLEAFSQSEDQVAFRTLVARHTNLVFGSAWRILGDRELTEEVSQNVFALLARRAPSLDASRGLAPWLYRTTWYEAKNARRASRRHQDRMKRYSKQQELNSSMGDHAEATVTLEAVRPVLDEAMMRLPEPDRQVLLMHYYEGLTFPEVAQRLGATSAAVQKRGVRALAKLSRFLRRRDAVVSATGLGTCLASQLTEAAPQGLAIALATKSVAAAPAISNQAILIHTLSAMKLSLSKTAIVLGAAILLVTPVAWQRSAIAKTKAKIRGLETAVITLRTTLGTTAATASPLLGTRETPARGGRRPTGLDLRSLADDAEAARQGDIAASLKLSRELDAQDATTLAILAEAVPALDLAEAKSTKLALAILRSLQKQDPVLSTKTAAELLNAYHGEHRRNISSMVTSGILRWSRSSPAEALAWFRQAEERRLFDSRSLPNGPDDTVRSNAIKGLFSGLFTSDRSAAIDLLESAKPPLASTVISRAGFYVKTDEGRQALARLALDLDDQSYDQAFYGIISSLRHEEGPRSLSRLSRRPRNAKPN